MGKDKELEDHEEGGEREEDADHKECFSKNNIQAIVNAIASKEKQLNHIIYISTSNPRPECEVSEGIRNAREILTQIKALWDISAPSLHPRRTTTPIDLGVIKQNIINIKKLLQHVNKELSIIIGTPLEPETIEETKGSIFSGPGPG